MSAWNSTAHSFPIQEGLPPIPPSPSDASEGGALRGLADLQRSRQLSAASLATGSTRTSVEEDPALSG